MGKIWLDKQNFKCPLALFLRKLIVKDDGQEISNQDDLDTEVI